MVKHVTFIKIPKTEQKHFEFNKVHTCKIVNNLYLIHKHVTNGEVLRPT